MAEARRKIIGDECSSNNSEPVSEDVSLRRAYEQMIEKDLDLASGDPKNMQFALEEKRFGNEYFKKKQFQNALTHYNNGILKCPQDSEKALEVLCMLIGNRSLVSFCQNDYEKVFKDLSYLRKLGNYPIHLQYKLSWRKAKCYEALKDYKSAENSFDEAIKLLSAHSQLEETVLKGKIKAIEDEKTTALGNIKSGKVENVRKKLVVEESGILRDIYKFRGSAKYPAASPVIDFRYNEHQGRYAVAKEDIPIGKLIIKEEPHAALVDKERTLNCCQLCFSYVDLPVACSTCTNVVYCSISCKMESDKSFHGIECPIYGILYHSFDKLLALRILTQRGFSFFYNQKEKLLSYLDLDDQDLTKKEVYRSDDYDNILFLFRNIKHKVHDSTFCLLAVYLLRILKATSFFPFETKDDVLLDDELFIGRLILRHCKMMSYNVHGINELKFFDYSCTMKNELGNNFLNEGIGVGIYPTLAFFNHSCEPSIIRYNVKKKVIVRTIKPIKAGDIIYDNYGPNFLFMSLEKRQQVLKTDYCFDCNCPPCAEKWPTVQGLEVKVKVPCKNPNCSFVFSLTHTKKPRRCGLCRKLLQHSDIEEITKPLKHFYNDAEKMFHEKKFEEALKSYKSLLEIMYRYTSRPDLDIVKVQERMEHIFARNGNRAIKN